MSTHTSTADTSLPPRVAHWVVVAAPLVAFQAIPSPGIFRLAFALPLVYLAVAFVRSRSARVPWWSVLLIAVTALSVLWGDDPGYSVQRLRTLLPVQLCFVVALAMCSSASILLALRRSFAIIIGLSMVYIVVSPSARAAVGSDSIHGQFAKNTYAVMLVFALVLLLAGHLRYRLPLVALVLVLIALNYSVTAWFVSFALVTLVVVGRWVSSRLGRRQSIPVLTLVALTLGVAIFTAIRVLGSSVLSVVGKDPSLSERTDIWAASWQQIEKAPLLGHGAFTFLDAASGSPVTQAIWLHFTRYLPPHPHNGLLDLWGQLGLVGVLVFVGLIARAVSAAALPAEAGSAPATTGLLGLAAVLLFGISEPTFLGAYTLFTFACVAMAEHSRWEISTVDLGPSNATRAPVEAAAP